MDTIRGEQIRIAPPETGVYVVRAVDANGFVVFDAVTITVRALMLAIVPDGVIQCPSPDSISVLGVVLPNDHISTLWKDAQTGAIISRQQSINVAGDLSAQYVFVVTDSLTGRSLYDTLIVTISPTPEASLSVEGATSLCYGDSVILKAPTGLGYYRWSNGVTNTNSIVVRDAGDYYCRITNANGCSATTDTVHVTQIPLPAKPTITRSHDTLYSSPADAYQWLWNGSVISGATQQHYVPMTTGLYSVIVKNQQGCSSPRSSAVNILVASVRDEKHREGVSWRCEDGRVLIHVSDDDQRNEQADIRVVDILGNVKVKARASWIADQAGQGLSIHVDGLIPGVYVVLIQTEGKVRQVKVVVP